MQFGYFVWSFIINKLYQVLWWSAGFVSGCRVLGRFQLETQFTSTAVTGKPFNLAAQKVGDLGCKIILAPLILAN